MTYDGHTTLARAYPLGIDAERLRRAAASAEVAEAEREVLERRRRYLIIRVDRADLSKNVLRGFTAFDAFLTQHPEFREQVTFIAHLQPSRQDVPEYAEYRERIEALVAVVNHRHGTTDWMPIDLKIYENFADAVARYKHYDLLMVNAIFDGMNLVAKEAPAVNTRDGVLMLSENTGSHQELWDYVLSVNPFDIQEQADTIYRALTMDAEQKAEWAQGLRDIIFARNPGDWVDDQLADIEKARGARASGAAGGRTLPLPSLRGDEGCADQVARGREGRGDRPRRPARGASAAGIAAGARAAAPGRRRRVAAGRAGARGAPGGAAQRCRGAPGRAAQPVTDVPGPERRSRPRPVRTSAAGDRARRDPARVRPRTRPHRRR